ncbi:MAG: hypothetical protein C0614_04750 [Desulfuromonas sp.]|nr:MAG: hypothetical protein C0614_04750 [Desulfuromonas sp.]
MVSQPEKTIPTDQNLSVTPTQKKQKSAWFYHEFSDRPVGIVVSDFDQDGNNEMAVAFKHALLITRVVEGQLLKVAEVDVPARISILSLGAMDLNQNGNDELYLTAVDGTQLSSFSLEYNGSDYLVTNEQIRWYLKVSEGLTGEKVLVGQFQGLEQDAFAGRPFRVLERDGQLVKGPVLNLPGQLDLYSFMPSSEGTGTFYAHLTESESLQVIDDSGTYLWESGEYFGGSESCYKNRPEHEGDMVVSTCLGPRILKNGRGEILVVQNEAQRFLKQLRSYSPSRLVAFSWDGNAMQESWRTVSQKGYLADFAIGDADNDGMKEIVTLVKMRRSGFFEKDRTAIISYRLQ